MSTTETQLEFDFMQPDQVTFDFDKDQSLYFLTASSSALLTLTPNYTVTFHREDKMIGKLDWNEGPMKFEGDADASAQLFFDNIIKRYFQSHLFAINPTGSGWKS